MATYAPRRSSGPLLHSTSNSGRFNSHTPPSSSSFASATSSVFTARSSAQASSSPAVVNLYSCSSPSLSFSLDRTGSQKNRSISMASSRVEKPATTGQKRTCMCSPTNHPGSFRCSLHKSVGKPQTASYGSSSSSSSRLNMRRSAMKNSVVRIGTVEGEWVKRALASLIRPSSHQQRRRGDQFRPRPSRLSVMSRSN